MALTKADLIEDLSKQGDLTKLQATEIVGQIFEELRLALEQGDQVKIAGFGNFDLRDKTERPGRNPKTGDAAAISARRVVTFRASQKLREQLSQIQLPA